MNIAEEFRRIRATSYACTDNYVKLLMLEERARMDGDADENFWPTVRGTREEMRETFEELTEAMLDLPTMLFVSDPELKFWRKF